MGPGLAEHAKALFFRRMRAPTQQTTSQKYRDKRPSPPRTGHLRYSSMSWRLRLRGVRESSCRSVARMKFAMLNDCVVPLIKLGGS